MKPRILVLFSIAVLLVTAGIARAQAPADGPGRIIVPESSVEHLRDIGKRAHTNHLILARGGQSPTMSRVETPGSLGCVYQTTKVPLSSGCPTTTTTVPTGGSGIIAIVDAFDYPTAENDLNVFSSQFGLPACTTANGCFEVVYASGTKPAVNCGWAQEAALDIEWAHAMAPGARLVLVEAASNSFTDLLQAVDVASSIVVGRKGTDSGEVSMSWGGSEFRGETTLDSHFTTTGVVYFAASGDSGGKVIYPSASPNVLSAGGTTINRDSSGNFLGESAWSSGGGGISRYESRPPYQDSIVSLVGTQRGTPDLSFDANPTTGVSVYDSTPCQGSSGWLVFGGTSVSAPSLAGIVNLAGSFYSLTSLELDTIYSTYSTTYGTDFRDITQGRAGKFRATAGWDFVTGVGSNLGVNGK